MFRSRIFSVSAASPRPQDFLCVLCVPLFSLLFSLLFALRSRLNAAEIRLPLLEKRVQSLQAVFRFKTMNLKSNLLVELVFQSLPVVRENRSLRVAQGNGRPSRQAFRQLPNFPLELIRREDAVDDSKPQRVLRRQRFRRVEQFRS